MKHEGVKSSGARKADGKPVILSLMQMRPFTCDVEDVAFGSLKASTLNCLRAISFFNVSEPKAATSRTTLKQTDRAGAHLCNCRSGLADFTALDDVSAERDGNVRIFVVGHRMGHAVLFQVGRA